ncbi:gastrula zinc finger protein XlCGF48.2-like isoform X1 [Astyanax mexicanus]|nr:gastrula zinc finger protein XlCGF48.2-like isoform X1 [Astyanax mexicanus]
MAASISISSGSNQPFSFQTRLSSVMEVMTRALVQQVCEMVDGDLARLRLELARALNEKASMRAKMQELEGEVKILRSARAGSRRLTKSRSVCVQTLEVLDAPSINGIFGKDWCSSLWDGKEPTGEKEVIEVKSAESNETLDDDDDDRSEIKEENPEEEICPSSTGADKSAVSARRKNPSSLPETNNNVLEVNLIDDDDDDDDDDSNNNNNEDNENPYFMSAGFLEVPEDQPLPASFKETDFTKIISADGTVKHVILPAEDQLQFEEHCIPIEYIEGENADAHLFQEQEVGRAQDLLMNSANENTSRLRVGENLNYFGRLERHKAPLRHGEPAKPRFRCQECGKMFLRQNSLILHRTSHQKLNSHRCHSCKVVFPQMNLLRTHKCMPPDNPSQVLLNHKFSCEHCGKRFHSRANLKVHYAVHTGERPHTCSYCGRGFTQKGNLNTHERIHRGEKPFMCLTCGKRFTQKVNLNHHLGIHGGILTSKTKKTGEKPE